MIKITNGIVWKDGRDYYIEQTIARGNITMKIKSEGLARIGELIATINGSTVALEEIHIVESAKHTPILLFGLFRIRIGKVKVRHIGLGTALVSELKKRCREENITKIVAKVNPVGNDAITHPWVPVFYKKLGFTKETQALFSFYLE